ncbi:MAG: tetratricopeptide repeat protein [Bacteroidales bacterium]|nr:tetratricopeptide repeat protein [Bacteroidales bacterium]
MKKFFLLIAAVSISIVAMPQKGKVTSALGYIDQGTLDKAKEAIDQALLDDGTMNWPNTYFAKGKLCQAAFKSDNPKFKAFYTDPLAESFTSYEKAMELDPKGGIKKKIITNMIYTDLAMDFFNQGSIQFEAKDFASALKSFESQIVIAEGDKYIGAIDTGMYYNAGLAAINSGSNKAAIKYFEKCAEMKYLGITPYYQIYESYLGLGDTIQAESVLKGLPDKFPGDKTITLQLIDLYIKSNKPDEAQKYIKVAKESDPTNSTLYFAAGIMYLNQSKYDEAIEELTKSIELNPDVYDAQYGLGAAYINKASDMFVKANEIMDVKKYSEAIDEANAVYSKALPYMEKANEINPEDVYALRSLQELYYRLKQTDKYNAIKAKLDAIEKK